MVGTPYGFNRIQAWFARLIAANGRLPLGSSRGEPPDRRQSAVVLASVKDRPSAALKKLVRPWHGGGSADARASGAPSTALAPSRRADQIASRLAAHTPVTLVSGTTGELARHQAPTRTAALELARTIVDDAIAREQERQWLHGETVVIKIEQDDG
jgi:hypothetical protein